MIVQLRNDDIIYYLLLPIKVIDTNRGYKIHRLEQPNGTKEITRIFMCYKL